MSFQFTQQELDQISALTTQAGSIGRYDAVYRRIRDIVEARGGYPNSEPIDVAQSRRWFAGAGQCPEFPLITLFKIAEPLLINMVTLVPTRGSACNRRSITSRRRALG